MASSLAVLLSEWVSQENIARLELLTETKVTGLQETPARRPIAREFVMTKARLPLDQKPQVRVIACCLSRDIRAQHTERRFFVFVAIAFLAIASLLANPLKAAQAPFYDLLSLEGNRIETGAEVGEGRWTLVMLWASDCHICKAQKPVISKFHDEHKDSDAHVFGIALDGRSGMKAVHSYLDQHPASFPNFVGDQTVVALNFLEVAKEQFRGTPTYVLFDPSGEVKGVNPGPVSVDALEAFIASHSE